MMTVLVLTMSMAVAGQVSTQPASNHVAASRPMVEEVRAAGVKADSPEGVYLAFFNAVRRGDVEGAVALTQPMEGEAAELVRERVRMQVASLGEMERLKAQMAAKFEGFSETDFDMGLMSTARAKTLGSEIDGESAVLTIEDQGKRIKTDIELKRVGGAWRVHPFDLAGLGTPAVMNEPMASEGALRGFNRKGKALSEAMQPIYRRMDEGRFSSAEVVKESVRRAIEKAYGPLTPPAR